ncbi:hypothetical protein ACJIZ3_015379 [Penstemon smallii]|uniref:Uncharacterized protein n=1 Tax=Penstemon smallii TaxID=265156 RepID=A0ABD3RQM8_9LAMI
MKKKLKMGFIFLKKISLLFLLISAALLCTSFAILFARYFHTGRPFNELDESKEMNTAKEELESWEQLRHNEVSVIHERLLKVKTNDYGRYDPAPAMVKPRFKLIPN